MLVRKLRDYIVVIIALNALILVGCGSSDTKYIDSGIEHLVIKAYKLAIDDFSAAIQENSENNDAYFLRAYSYYESAATMEDIELARNDFTSYIEHYEDAELREIKDLNIGISLDRAYIGRAITYHQNCEAFGDIKSCQMAVDDLVQASRISPGSWQVYQTLGIVYETYSQKSIQGERDGWRDRSIQAYNKARKLR
ncbi:MAG: hypothetical protein FI698_02865 [SAR202 cluster bacterium]|nr:hypothetical protein [SAR202 cluster bacterium]|tara:strand:+ start:33911 stop:34498 length:588 start_codon:yes stop_codon:yes gene_type:complete